MRRAKAADAAQLATLHARSFAQGWGSAAFASLLDDPSVSALVSGEPAAGFILIRTAAGEGEVLTLAVDPSARRAGHGGALVEAAVGAAQSRGAETLFLEVAADNAAALALYRSAGFIQTGRRKGYYARAHGAAMDALVLSRALGENGSQNGGAA